MLLSRVMWRRVAFYYLAAILATVQSTKAPVYRIQGSDITVEYNTVDCSKDNVIQEWRSNHRICVNDARWRARGGFKTASETIIEGIDSDHMQLLLGHFGRFQGKRSSLLNFVDKTSLADMVANISDAAIGNLSKDLPHLDLIIPLMSPAQTRKVPDAVMEKVLGDISEPKAFIKLVNSLHEAVVTSQISAIKTKLTDEFTSIELELFEPGVLRKLFAEDDFCGSVSPKHILSLGEVYERAKLVPPSCFAQVPWGDEATECDRRFRYFSEKALSEYDGEFSESCLAMLTSTMVSNYNSSRAKDGDHCQNLVIPKLPISALSGVSAKCLYSYFAKYSGEEPITLGAHWIALPDDSLVPFVDGTENIAKIHKGDWEYISITQKQVLVKDPATCEHLPVQFFRNNGQLPISNECFEKLPKGKVKAAALLHAQLLDLALANVTSLSDWSVPLPSGESVTGIKVLELAGHVSNIDRLIFLMSSADVNNDACAEIETVSQLIEMPLVQAHCSQKCVDNLKEKPGLDDLGKLNPRIAGMVSLESLVEKITSGEWASFEVNHFSRLMGGGKLCKLLNSTILNELNSECVKIMNANCVADISTWKEVEPKVISNLSPASLRLVDADMALAFNYAHLSDQQFAELGADVPASKTPAIKWTKETVSAFSASRAAKVSAVSWGATPAGAFEGLRAEHVLQIPPAATIDISADQVKAIPNDAIAVLSEAQAQEIGKTHQGSAKSPIPILLDAPLDPKVKAVIEARKPKKINEEGEK